MAEITLVADTGRPIGSRPAGRLRANGKIPGTVYGLGEQAVSVAVDWRELRAALTTEAALNALINLQVEGNEQLTIVKELQRHPVRRDVIHVDFLRVSRDVAIEVEVPLVLHGEAEAVEREGGVIEHTLYTLTVSAKPADIPSEIPVDISGLQIGDAVRVGDLQLPAGVTTGVDAEEPIVLAQAPMAEEAAEPAEGEEAEAAAEGAEGEPAAEGGAEAAEDGGGGESSE